MSLQRSSQPRFWPAALRWSAAALVVAGAHGAAGWVVATWQRAEAAAGAPPAAVMIELAPLAVAPETPPQEIAPGPQMAESEPEPPPPEPVETPKEPDPPPPEEPEPVALPEPEIKIPELPPLPDPAAVLSPPPKQEPPPPPKEVKRKPPPKPKVVQRRKPVNPDKPRSEQNSAPTAQAQIAPRAAAPASGASSASPAATASWRGTLIAHLNRFKRFPTGANPGTVQVAFSIDRGGRVLSARLVRGSGDAALDQEAVAMIRRASPVPAPPDGLGGGSISLSVPIRFSR
ncbi:energy transducer TonB family protein [Bosea sp. (in: a-proteobacteria)]